MNLHHWTRWIGVWLALLFGLGFLFVTLLGPGVPRIVAWAGAVLLSGALTFLLARQLRRRL